MRYTVVAGWLGLGTLVALVGLAIYSNILDAPFVFDDTWVIRIAPRTEYSSLRNALRDPRSLVNATFHLNYRFGGLDTRVYHATNIGIHIGATWIAMWLAYQLTQQAGLARRIAVGRWVIPGAGFVAVVVGLFFVSHPLQTQAVTYTVQRLESLATLFYLLALASYVQFRRSRHRAGYSWAVVSLVSTVLSMHSKETAATIPVMVVAIEYFFFSTRWRSFRRRLPWLLPWLLTLLIIPGYKLGLWSALFAGSPVGLDLELADLEQATAETSEVSRLSYLGTQLFVVLRYLRLLLVPVGQNIDHDVPFVTMFTPALLGAFCVVVLLWGGLLWTWRRARLLSFGGLFFFVALSVTSSIIPIRDPMFEHRLYLAFWGFAVVVACGIYYVLTELQLRYRRQWLNMLGVGVVAGLIVLLSVLTYQRNEVWTDPVALWSDATRKSPDKARPYMNLAEAYLSRGDAERAREFFDKARARDPHYLGLQNNLGALHLSRGKIDQAQAAFEREIELHPNFVGSYVNLGLLYLERGNVERALEYFERARQLDIADPAVWHGLGMALHRQGKLDEAEAAIRETLRLHPEYPGAHNNLGGIHLDRGNLQAAQEAFEWEIARNPMLILAHRNLALVYWRMGRTADAVRVLQHVLKLAPHDTEARQLLQQLSAPAPIIEGLHFNTR